MTNWLHDFVCHGRNQRNLRVLVVQLIVARGRLYAGHSGQRLKQVAFRADDADLAVCDLDALG